MESSIPANGISDSTNGTANLCFEFDGEGDADSSTTPGHNIDLCYGNREYKHFLTYIIISR